MEHLLFWDRELFLLLHGLGSPPYDVFWIFVTGKLSWIPLYILLLYFRFRFHRSSHPKDYYKRFFIEFLLIVVVVGLCDWLSVHAFKNVFQRLRPTHEPDLILAIRSITGKGGLYGFVSSHAANVFGLAAVLSLLFKNRWAAFFLFAWAALVSYSRIYVGKHYPLDLLGGAILGISIAWIFHKIYHHLLKMYLESKE